MITVEIEIEETVRTKLYVKVPEWWDEELVRRQLDAGNEFYEWCLDEKDYAKNHQDFVPHSVQIVRQNVSTRGFSDIEGVDPSDDLYFSDDPKEGDVQALVLRYVELP